MLQSSHAPYKRCQLAASYIITIILCHFAQVQHSKHKIYTQKQYNIKDIPKCTAPKAFNIIPLNMHSCRHGTF